jgi:hypothetical protein
MCDYMGYEFGGGYIDSMCIDGRLYDGDNCDDQGNLYEPMEDIPCPMCHPKKAMDYWAHRNECSGSSPSQARKAARLLVTDIRRNRGVETRF